VIDDERYNVGREIDDEEILIAKRFDGEVIA